jgi:predicted GIY-YIG superfamily endonuclease
MEGVYIIHFNKPLNHAMHYIGYSNNIERRIKRHERGDGAAILRVLNERGIGWRCVAMFPGQKRDFERFIKNKHNTKKYCPICMLERRKK